MALIASKLDKGRNAELSHRTHSRRVPLTRVVFRVGSGRYTAHPSRPEHFQAAIRCATEVTALAISARLMSS